VILVAPANASFGKCLKKTVFNGKNRLLEIDLSLSTLPKTFQGESKRISFSYKVKVGV
jgi:hypothetical protein